MKRIEPTIVEKATQMVDGFARVYKMLQHQVVLRGQSKRTLENYFRRKALIINRSREIHNTRKICRDDSFPARSGDSTPQTGYCCNIT